MATATETNNVDNVDEDYPISADPSKYVTLPVQNEKIWNKYQETLEWFWTVYDVDIVYDKELMKTTFNEEQAKDILRILAFMFTTHRTTLNKNLFMQLMNQADIKEAVYYLGSQADAKKTHGMMYSMILDELLRDQPGQKDNLIREIATSPLIRDFLRWSVLNTTSETLPFGHRLLYLATLQGIIFAVPFVLFSWLQKEYKNSMPGLSQSNGLIWRDEKLNLSFSCLMFEFLDETLDDEDAHRIIREAVSHAKKLFIEAMPASRLGMESDLVEQFIEHSADDILSKIRVPKIYNKECPFDWVEEPVLCPTKVQNEQKGNNMTDSSRNLDGPAHFDLEDF